MTRYLVGDRKDNYIIHIVRAQEDKTLTKSYEPVLPSLSLVKAKQERITKEEKKRPATKKVKKEFIVKVYINSYDLIN